MFVFVFMCVIQCITLCEVCFCPPVCLFVVLLSSYTAQCTAVVRVNLRIMVRVDYHARTHGTQQARPGIVSKSYVISARACRVGRLLSGTRGQIVDQHLAHIHGVQ